MAADCALSILATVGGYLIAPIGRQLGYLLCYKSNIEDFRENVKNLEAKKDGVQGRVDAADRNGDVILPDVRKWLTEVDEITNESRKFFDDELKVDKRCFNGPFPDLKLRYKRSRNAEKKIAVVDELKQDGSKFNTVSYPAAPPAIGSTSTEDAEVFESRKLIFKEIMEALKDDEINLIGIYGMGGVGKTTLVKEVGKQAKDDSLFDEVVMATVSQTPKLQSIQDELVDTLGLIFVEKSDLGRARRLFARDLSKRRESLSYWTTFGKELI